MATTNIPVAELLLAKRLASLASELAEKADPISPGVAISLMQDAVESFLWILIKHKVPNARNKSSFEGYIDEIEKAGYTIPLKSKLIDLNKARVGFKHYGIRPAPSEAQKYKVYVSDFLIEASSQLLNIDFDNVSLIDLVSYADVRDKLKEADQRCRGGDVTESLKATAIAKGMLVSRVDPYFPKIGYELSKADNLLQKLSGGFPLAPFKYIEEVLRILRASTVESTIGAPLSDQQFLRSALPRVIRYDAGNWETMGGIPNNLNEADAERAIRCVVNMSFKVHELVG